MGGCPSRPVGPCWSNSMVSLAGSSDRGRGDVRRPAGDLNLPMKPQISVSRTREARSKRDDDGLRLRLSTEPPTSPIIRTAGAGGSARAASGSDGRGGGGRAATRALWRWKPSIPSRGTTAVEEGGGAMPTSSRRTRRGWGRSQACRCTARVRGTTMSRKPLGRARLEGARGGDGASREGGSCEGEEGSREGSYREGERHKLRGGEPRQLQRGGGGQLQGRGRGLRQLRSPGGGEPCERRAP